MLALSRQEISYHQLLFLSISRRIDFHGKYHIYDNFNN